MPRPKRCRRVGVALGRTLFKPASVPSRHCAEVILTLDGLEALRLADFEGLYHEEAAQRMGVSRQTFGRILESARKTVAQALVMGLVLRIEGGPVQMTDTRTFTCADCGHSWQVPFGGGRPQACPACQSNNLYRADDMQAASAGADGRCRRKQLGGRRRRCQGGGRGRSEIQCKETNQ
ncbi:DUF134 domain-containing protein [Thermopirellula anaerolimosa]